MHGGGKRQNGNEDLLVSSELTPIVFLFRTAEGQATVESFGG